MMPNSYSSMMKIKTRSATLLLSFMVVFSFMLAACGGGTQQKTTVVSYGYPGGLLTQNFNPFLVNFGVNPSGLIYERLLYFNRLSGKVTPWLASSYEFSTDATRATIHLQPNVQWSDGQPFTSADVVFTLNLLKQFPALDTNGLWIYLKDVTAPDSSTVSVTLKKPYSPILWYLAGQTAIVSKHIWSSVSDPVKYADATPVGTGPFMFKSFTPQLVVLNKNPKYWQSGKPQVSQVRILSFTSNSSAELQLDQGSLDWSQLYIPNIQQTYVMRDSAHNKYWSPPYVLDTFYVNLTKYPLNLLPVRQAISLAIDRNQVNKQAESGFYPVASPTGLILPAQQKYLSPAYANASFTVDINKANQLLQSAGFTKGSDGIYADKNGQKIAFAIDIPSSFTDLVTESQIIAANLEAIGMNVSVNAAAFGAIFSSMQLGSFDSTIGPTSNGPSPYFMFNGLLNSKQSAPVGKPATTNWERWNDPTSDQLLAQYSSTTDPAVQMQAIQGLEKIMVEQLPVIPLLNAAAYAEYSTAHFTGWPDANNPYALAVMYQTPDQEMVVLNLKPV